jgi:hypothetical protein
MDIPKTAFELGQDAHIARLPVKECPYDKMVAKQHWLEWRRGWISSKAAAEAASIQLFDKSELLYAPASDVTDVKTDNKETLMGKSGKPDPFNTPEPPKKKPPFLPKDRPWSKEAENTDDDEPGWESSGEGWKDPKPKDDK